LAPAGSGIAQTQRITAPKEDPKKTLARLEKQADALNKDYRGELIALSEVRRTARQATERADQLNLKLKQSIVRVKQLAAISYMGGGLDPTRAVTSPDLNGSAADLALVAFVAQSDDTRVGSLTILAKEAVQAGKNARQKIAVVQRTIKELLRKRVAVKKLLAKYKPEGAGRPDGAPQGKSPLIGNTMTPRMRTLYLEVDQKFGTFPAIGCFRAGDPQDHGTGRACDFMESSGGRMPTASAQAHGDAVAQYVIDNASRVGLKYVIWKQRIWDVRSGNGWKAMSNRGGVTANHFDHVHVSVL
jgi:hypothetical protein